MGRRGLNAEVIMEAAIELVKRRDTGIFPCVSWQLVWACSRPLSIIM